MSDSLVILSREIMQKGSKSFAAAARLLPRDVRISAYLLYAWCRRCDDIIDGQELGRGADEDGRPPQERLAWLRQETARALAGEAVEEPVFHALGLVARRHDLAPALPFELIEGFAMDVAQRRYETQEDILSYCYHVAGVVGVMMASVMGARDEDTLNRAADLGIAFQLTNIARDVLADAQIGRVYLPHAWLQQAGLTAQTMIEPRNRAALAQVVARLLDLAEPFYASARVGIDRLPPRCAWGIATALRVYRDIGMKVRRRGLRAWDDRISTSRRRKLYRAAGGLKDVLRRAIPWPRSGVLLDRSGLWTRPALR